jgi:hypothetical protein
LAIYDFNIPSPQRRPYSHLPGLFSYKMDFSRLFTCNPIYRVLARRYFEHGARLTYDPHEAISIDVVRKDSASTWRE